MLTEHDLPWLSGPLRQLRDHAPGHAMILHGGMGSGLLQLGVRTALAWLCEQGPGPCDRCSSCHQGMHGHHPDLKVVVPEALRPALGWTVADGDGDGESAEAVSGDSKSSKRKPSREIKVAAVRDAIDWSHTSSGRGRGKVLVFFPADAMNLVAANALLKTLEEPPQGLRILLCVNDPEHLLPTLRSRCQRLRLPLPDTSTARAWLSARGVAGAEVLLAACGGEPVATQQLAQEGMGAALWAELPRQVARGDARELAAMAVPQALRVLQCLCHDAMAKLAGGPPRFFPAESVPLPADWGALSSWSQSLTRVARHQDHPWSAGLLIEALVAEGRQALAGAQPNHRPGSAQRTGRRVDTLSA